MGCLMPEDAPMMLAVRNDPSKGLREKLGLPCERPVPMPEQDRDVSLYRIEFAG